MTRPDFSAEALERVNQVVTGDTRNAQVGGVITAEALRTVGEGPVCVSPDEVVADTRNAQVGGDHYRRHSIQPWDIWQEYGLNAFEGAVLKYLLRRKGDRVEDLRKARHTLDRLIEIEEARGGVLRPEGEEAPERPGGGVG